MNTLFKILYVIFFVILAVVLIKFFLVLLLISLVLLWLRTFQMKKEPHQQQFLQGSLPNPKPDGPYQGTMGFDVSWIGKKFDAQNSVGINVFKNKKNGQITDGYPFKTYVARGLFDPIFVLRIDYNVPGNPFWVKYIVDEIVQVAPNEYLGKMHLKLIPGLPFSVLYFELKK